MSVTKYINRGTGLLVIPRPDMGKPFITEIADAGRTVAYIDRPNGWGACFYMVGTLGDPRQGAGESSRALQAIVRSQYYTEGHFEWDIRARCWKIYLS